MCLSILQNPYACIDQRTTAGLTGVAILSGGFMAFSGYFTGNSILKIIAIAMFCLAGNCCYRLSCETFHELRNERELSRIPGNLPPVRNDEV